MARQASTAELHTPDLPLRDIPSIETASDLDDIVIVNTEEMAAKEYLDELDFMREPVEVYIHRGRERFAPSVVQLGVNGRMIWVPVEQKVTLTRSYVEVLARSQPIDVRTEASKVENSDSAATLNFAHQTPSANYAFTVTRDNNPKGHAWLAKVMRES